MEQMLNSIPKADVLTSASHDHKPIFRPMLFSTPMVKALLEGRKTQTRRIVKLPKEYNGGNVYKNGQFGIKYETNDDVGNIIIKRLSPKIKIGDIIWVRETFSESLNPNEYCYKADTDNPIYLDKNWKWKPSLFMPKSVCRLFLEITNVRVERIHDISEADAIAEGIEAECFNKEWWYKNYIENDSTLYPCISYQTLWAKIHGKKSWDENPYVWIYDFEVSLDCPHGFR